MSAGAHVHRGVWGKRAWGNRCGGDTAGGAPGDAADGAPGGTAGDAPVTGHATVTSDEISVRVHPAMVPVGHPGGFPRW